MTGILRISEAASLAMHTMSLLAGRHGRRLSTGRIAEIFGASEATLSKVMQRLGRAGLVESVRGPKGGFALTGDPAAITLMEVYRAVEGDFPPAGCLLGKPVCEGAGCILGGMIETVDQQVRQHLETVTLAELAGSFEIPESGTSDEEKHSQD